MSITPELFLAILSMDAYNRDYGAGIEGLGGEGSQIGTATLLKDSHILVDESGRRLDIASGFYAIAYDTPDGTVISYRGTDNDPDYLRGWVMGAGLEPPWTQADEALSFYSAVKGANPTANITITGHSLGGGLAGFVSALTGTKGYGFDYMPVGTAAAPRTDIRHGDDAA